MTQISKGGETGGVKSKALGRRGCGSVKGGGEKARRWGEGGRRWDKRERLWRRGEERREEEEA